MIGNQFQAALYSKLVGQGLCGGRVYDQVPESPVFPYVTIGDEQHIDDSSQCQDGWEVYPDVHVWSRPANGSKAEVKTLAAQVVDAVKTLSVVQGFTVVSIFHETSRFLRDPDGKTEHAAITFRAVLDPE